MRIDAENSEEVIFDFHEGNLSDREEASLMDFLHKHPEFEGSSHFGPKAIIMRMSL